MRASTRLTDWPTGAPLAISLFASAGDPAHLGLALDAIASFHPGSNVAVHVDGPFAPEILGAEAERLQIQMQSLEADDAGRAADLLILLHPWPYLDPEKSQRLAAVRRAFRRAASRNPRAQAWILFRDLNLWQGSTAASIRRRAIDSLLRPVAAKADRMERQRLSRIVLPDLPAAARWDGDRPCAHAKRRRIFDRPRMIDFCPECGMGLTPPEAVPKEDESRKLYGAGYARFGRYAGWKEFERYAAENIARVNGYLKALGFENDSPSISAGNNPRVLDYGCGSGRYAPLWIERGYRYFGADFSEANIAFARERIDRLGLSADAEWLVASIDNPPLADRGPFAIIFLSHVMEHIPDPLALLKGLRSLAAPSAILYVEVPDAFNYCWNLNYRGYANYEHLSDFTAPMLAAISKEAGWSSIRTHRDPETQEHPFVALLAKNR